MNSKSEHKKLNIFCRCMKVVVVISVLMIALLGSSSFAKYYSMQQQKGVAVASDFYFSSDILKSGVTINNNNEPEDFSSLTAYRANTWHSNDTSSVVDFLVRNYDNNLLYNDENIEIEYTVYAKLAEEDSSGDISYYLVDSKNNSVRKTLTENSVAEITGVLTGGEILSNSYYIQYEHAANTQATPVDIYVWVVPTYPSYMPKNQYSMGSVISIGKASNNTFTFESKWGFLELNDSTAELSQELKNVINSQIGFVYNISTTGSNTTDVNVNEVNVRISWDSKYVEMDRFSKFYNSTFEQNGTIKTMDIVINTYTSNDILFYRTSNFNINAFATQGDFQNLVTAVRLEQETKEAAEDVE